MTEGLLKKRIKNTYKMELIQGRYIEFPLHQDEEVGHVVDLQPIFNFIDEAKKEIYLAFQDGGYEEGMRKLMEWFGDEC
jgi:hypothetical protein